MELGIGDERIQGRITAVSICAQYYVSYEVVWWDGRERKDAWVPEFEVFPVNRDDGKSRIGFGHG